MEFVREHGVELLAIYGGLVAICSAIVKITPTQKDDAIFAKIMKVLDWFSVAFNKADKKVLDKAKEEK